MDRLIIEEAHPAPISGMGEAYAARMSDLSKERRPDRAAWAAYLESTRGASSARSYLQSLEAVDEQGGQCGPSTWGRSPRRPPRA